jgi:hypothetical protein
MNFLRAPLMSIFDDRDILTGSAIVGSLGILVGCTSQFARPVAPDYYFGYGLIVGSALLLLITLAAWRFRRMMPLLRWLLGGLAAALLVVVLLGYDPTAKLRPQGRFVSAIERPQPCGPACGASARAPV